MEGEIILLVALNIIIFILLIYLVHFIFLMLIDYLIPTKSKYKVRFDKLTCHQKRIFIKYGTALNKEQFIRKNRFKPFKTMLTLYNDFIRKKVNPYSLFRKEHFLGYKDLYFYIVLNWERS